ncbi:TonB-dependent receptor family protein [Chitinophaga horti]|uniref:TonB-dependent receptor family protein n=1 Tax=Chitinophaga horti TaxID=2920382 RepID=A0ABY6J6H0_9BACT|nr:TonB-dependent receptor [Chitinophaga horti]UYQ95269.1 TonB-dependent receptor family protein [Chitinophaga horti]
MKKFGVTIGFILMQLAVFAQQRDSTLVGQLDGIVRDSLEQHMMPSATVAIYDTRDSSLISYRLTDAMGGYIFTGLPVGRRLKMIVSYTGYRPLEQRFIIPADRRKLDLGYADLRRRTTDLAMFEVKAIPPVTMNGDTLEFHADAFALDTNAVVEDLFRRLPGMTLWGDGKITLNGREVKRVLVEGKSFFGDDPRIAMQNLPKNVVDKIQVYEKSKNKDNPQHSDTEVNIKLKKDKKTGLFGKLGAGLGTDDRKEAEINLNLFSPKTQLAFAGAGNNTNRTANDVTTLIRNAAFKSVSPVIDYLPDFYKQGIAKSFTGGISLDHEFVPERENQLNRLASRYFVTNNQLVLEQQSQTVSALSAGNTQLLDAAHKELNREMNHHATFTHTNQNPRHYTYLDANLKWSDNQSEISERGAAYLLSTDTLLQSTNNSTSQSHNTSRDLTFRADYSNHHRMTMKQWLPKVYSSYTLSLRNNDNARWQQSEFVAADDPSQHVSYDRRYQQDKRGSTHNYVFRLEDLQRLWSGKDLIFSVQHTAWLNHLHQDNSVSDRDGTGHYILNPYLTNKNHLRTFRGQPSLNIRREFYKSFPGRYNRRLLASLAVQGEYYWMANESGRAFQQLERRWQRFTPNASVYYQKNNYGEWSRSMELRYRSSAMYPTIDQLAPLVDSGQIWNLQLGNAQLKPASKDEVAFSFKHNSEKAGRDFYGAVELAAGIVHDAFADSSFYEEGRRRYYVVNGDQQRFINAGTEVKRSFKLKQHQLQFTLKTNGNLSLTPNYVEGLANNSRNLSGTAGSIVGYTLPDRLQVNASDQLTWYQSTQTGANELRFSNKMNVLALDASLVMSKSLVLSSNLNYNTTTSDGGSPIRFTIWNANVAYRLLKGKNLECKLSVMDLLRQNTNVINKGYNNTLVRGTVNVLQQYFMLTLAYYPRKFGSK